MIAGRPYAHSKDSTTQSIATQSQARPWIGSNRKSSASLAPTASNVTQGEQHASTTNRFTRGQSRNGLQRRVHLRGLGRGDSRLSTARSFRMGDGFDLVLRVRSL